MCIVKSPTSPPLSAETEAELQRRMEAWQHRRFDPSASDLRRRFEEQRRRALGMTIPIEGDKRR